MAEAADSTPLRSFPALVGRDLAGETVPTVDARELHRSLGVGRDFTTWIRDRIDTYGFKSGTDFVVFTNSGENLAGGRPAKDYALTFDMAKELAMVERNDAGRQIRRYFIACERSLRERAAGDPPRSAPTAGPSPLPFLPGPERLVSSLHVAQALRRRHTGILRLLDVLAAERPELLDRHLRFATYLHDNGRPYRCFHMDRTGFAALMARIPFTDGRAEALRENTLRAWPEVALPPPPSGPPAAIADGHAMMRIGGETLIVDMRNFEPDKSERAVLFTIDGGMRIDRAVCYNPNRAREGRRLGYGLTPMPSRPGRDYFELGWIIGTVIEPTVAKGADGRGTAAEPCVPGASRPVRSTLSDLAAAVALGAA